MRGAQALGVALLCVLGTVASAQSTGLLWGDEIPCNAADDGALRPRVAVNGSGFPVVLWGDHQPMVQRVAVGDGTAFSAPVEVSAGLVPAVADWMGGDIAAAGPTVWVVMKATPEETRPVYVRRSDDGGFTWGDTLRVDPFDGRVSRFPSIAVADPEAPLVQYMQFDSGYFGARQVVSRRTGGVFTAPVQVSAPFAPGEVCDCCTGQVVAAADGYGTVVMPWGTVSNVLRVHWTSTLRDSTTLFAIDYTYDAYVYYVVGQSYPLAELVTAEVTLFGGTTTTQFSRWLAEISTGLDAPAVEATVLQVAPNPAEEAVRLSLPASFQGDVTVELVDAAGRTVRREQLLRPAGPAVHMALGTLTEGCYLVRAVDGEGHQATGRFIKR